MITSTHLKKKDRPDTIFCKSDEILSGSVKAIQQHNLAIPADICPHSHQQRVYPFFIQTGNNLRGNERGGTGQKSIRQYAAGAFARYTAN
jgi:hypothetical protein